MLSRSCGRRLVCAAAWVVLLLPGSAHAGSAADWTPKKNVEILVGVAAGGALDVNARQVQKIWQDRRLVDVPTTVVNRVGGGGILAWSSLVSRAGDAHAIAFASPTLLSNHIVGASTLSHADFTPIALLNSDFVVFVVNAAAPVPDTGAMLARLKGGTLRVGNGGALANSAHVALARVARASGIDPKSIKLAVFNSGAQAMSALLGDHVDLVATATANAAPHVVSGKLRALAVASRERLPATMAHVPTWRELGLDVTAAFWQAVIAPKGLTVEQIRYWDRVFAATTASPEWRELVVKNLWGGAYLNSAETGRFFENDDREVRAELDHLGLAKH